MKRLPLFLLLPAALVAAQGRYARLGEFEGRVEVQLSPASDWMAAERNLPLPESAWLRTGPSSRVEIELDEGSVWRLGPNSQCEISDYSRLSTGQRVTLLSLDRGVAYFTGQPEGKDALALAVPGAQVTLTRHARVRIEAQESWSQISVLDGALRFSSPAAEIDLRQGQTTRVEPSNPARFFLNKEIAPLDLDRWSDARDKALASPTSAGHVIERYGLADLDAAGEWIQTEDLGPVWKPKTPDGWLPFRNGRWRWYDALGYTWVSDDPWGWLPYHYGRWTRRENLGWIWAPAKNAVFKPGEVYWLRGARVAGWGPLAPGEEPQPSTGSPQQYLNVNTTFAEFRQDAALIDPAAFAAPPKDPLVAASFVAALPSPAFAASRLDAARPLRAGKTRVVPVVDEVAFQGSSAPTLVIANPPPPPPVVIVSEPPPDLAPTAPPADYPVPVYTGIIVQNPLPSKPAPTVKPPATPQPVVAAAPQPKGRRTETNSPHPRPPAAAPARGKGFRNGEAEIVAEVVKDVNAGNFAKAAADLDAWIQRYPRTDFQDDRIYYSIVAYNGMRQPAKVVDAARPLLAGDLVFQDSREMILALYLTSLNAQKLPTPSSSQLATGEIAARSLLSVLPEYFASANKPPETTPADWAKARTDLETTARTTLAMHSRR